MGFLQRNLALAHRHTKEFAYKILVRPQLEYVPPIWHPYHETQIAHVKKVRRTAAMWTCRRWRNTSSVGDMLDELEWPSMEARREQSSLAFFYKIHSGTVSLDKDSNGSFRPCVVSAMSRFGPGSLRPESFRPWVVSANLRGSFWPDFSTA